MPWSEEPDALIAHVRICGSRGRVTALGHPAIAHLRGDPSHTGYFAVSPRSVRVSIHNRHAGSSVNRESGGKGYCVNGTDGPVLADEGVAGGSKLGDCR